MAHKGITTAALGLLALAGCHRVTNNAVSEKPDHTVVLSTGPAMASGSIKNAVVAGVHLGMPASDAKTALSRLGIVKTQRIPNYVGVTRKYNPLMSIGVRAGEPSPLPSWIHIPKDSPMTVTVYGSENSDAAVVNGITVDFHGLRPSKSLRPTFEIVHNNSVIREFISAYGNDANLSDAVHLKHQDECPGLGGIVSGNEFADMEDTLQFRYLFSAYRCDDDSITMSSPYAYVSYRPSNHLSSFIIRSPM